MGMAGDGNASKELRSDTNCNTLAAFVGNTIVAEAARRVAILTLPLLLPVVAAQADDWPQWRGLNRDSVWNETGLRETFPSAGLKARWHSPVGFGYSSPVVA